MNIKSLSEFKKDLEATLDIVSDSDDCVIINRPENKDIVLISLNTYNSIQETLFLMSSVKNKERLDKAVNDINMNVNLVEGDIII